MSHARGLGYGMKIFKINNIILIISELISFQSVVNDCFDMCCGDIDFQN